MRALQYLLLTVVCAAGAALMADFVGDQITASFERSAAIIRNPQEAAR